jgi:hypothetical protein
MVAIPAAVPHPPTGLIDREPAAKLGAMATSVGDSAAALGGGTFVAPHLIDAGVYVVKHPVE